MSQTDLHTLAMVFSGLTIGFVIGYLLKSYILKFGEK